MRPTYFYLKRIGTPRHRSLKEIKEPFSPFIDRERFSLISLAKKHFWITLLICSVLLNISLSIITKETIVLNLKFHEMVAVQTHKTEIAAEENKRLVSHVENDSPSDIVQIGTVIHEIMNTAQSEVESRFLSEVLPHAIRFQIQKNIPVSGMIAQAIYESGYGKSELAKRNFNYFGLKAPTDGSVPYSMMTTTDLGVVHDQPFRKFSSPYEGFCGYYNFLTSPDKKGRYDNALHQTTGVGFVRCLLKDGYCPNSDYLSAIEGIIAKHHLDKLEKIINNKKREVLSLADINSQLIL